MMMMTMMTRLMMMMMMMVMMVMVMTMMIMMMTVVRNRSPRVPKFSRATLVFPGISRGRVVPPEFPDFQVFQT